MTPGVFVERGAPTDASALARLAGECFGQPWSERQFEEELLLPPPSGVLVARARQTAGSREAAAVAFCACRVVLDELHVMDVAVAPPLRRRGVARQLLALALCRGARAGARVALLEVRAGNAGAIALYESLGFRRSGRRRDYYRDPPEDALLLERASLDELC